MARAAGEKRTQEWLAGKVGVPKWTVAKWEIGQQEPTMSNLLKLAEVLDVSPQWLAIGDERTPETGFSTSHPADPEEEQGGGEAAEQYEAPGPAEAPHEEEPRPAAPIERLAAVLAEPETLALVLARLPIGDVLSAAYATARELGWTGEKMTSLDAAALAALREAGITSDVEADRRRRVAELRAAKDRLRAEGEGPETRPYGEGRSRPRRRRGA